MSDDLHSQPAVADPDEEQKPAQLDMFLSFGEDKESKIKIVNGSLVIREDISQEEVREAIRNLHTGEGRIKIWKSDLIAFGRRKFGAAWMDATLQQLEFLMPDVKVAMDIASVPLEIRQESLTDEHYVVLGRADISFEEKARWAKAAHDQRLKPKQLKDSIVAGEVVTEAVSRTLTHGVVTIQGIRGQFDMLLRKMGGLNGILKLPAGDIAEWRNNLEAFAVLYAQLGAPKRKKGKLAKKQKKGKPAPKA